MPVSKTAILSDGIAEVSFSLDDGLNFQGRLRPHTNIQFYGPLRHFVSMANVSVQFCNLLIQKFGDIAIQNYTLAAAELQESPQSEWTASELEPYSGLNRGAKLGIFYGVPIDVPEKFYQHPIRIGCFVCETDLIEQSWVDICNRFDLIVVPSQWCKSAFNRSGVKPPILVVAHGLEPEYRPYKNKSTRHHQPFVFYSTFYANAYCSRKSLEELVRTFLRTFKGRDDVILRIRTDSKAKLRELQKKYNFGELIHIDSSMGHDTESFARIYSEVHCTVHPAKGEGFGFVPFQSIACETPVIAMHETGMADYLSPDNSISLKTSGRVKGEGAGNAVGTYFAVDESHLERCLLHAFHNWQEEYQKVHALGANFRQQYQWSEVLAELMEVTQLLLESNSALEKQNVLELKIAK
ncbi:MAG: glycosyltransferase [Arenicella sp.]|nr:glycosyltransferase [Arenicella sp.]